MKFLIAGLGNIGSEYSETRHNAGFDVVDYFVKSLSEKNPASFEAERYAAVAELRFRGKSLVIIKPSTYVNLSGNAVGYWMQKEHIALENILIIADDLALPFGTLRLKSKGGDGGHNGLKHIQETLGTEAYSRLRFGIGSDFKKGKQVDYVLGKWGAEEKKILEEKLKLSTEIIKSFVLAGVELTMTQFNKKQ